MAAGEQDEPVLMAGPSPGKLQDYATDVEDAVRAEMHAAALHRMVGSPERHAARDAADTCSSVQSEHKQHRRQGSCLHAHAANVASHANARSVHAHNSPGVKDSGAAQASARLQQHCDNLARQRDAALARLAAMQQRCTGAEQAAHAAEQRPHVHNDVQSEHLRRQLQAERDASVQSGEAAQQSIAKCNELQAALQSTAAELQRCRQHAAAAEHKQAQSILQLRQACTQTNSELDAQRQAAQTADAAREVAVEQSAKLKDANSRLKGDLREAEGLLRRADHDR